MEAPSSRPMFVVGLFRTVIAPAFHFSRYALCVE